MTASAELFAVIASALSPLDPDISQDRGKRIYLAYVTARVGMGEDGTLEERMTELRTELGI